MSNTRIVTKPVLIAVEGKNVCRFLKNRMDKTPQQFDKIDLIDFKVNGQTIGSWLKAFQASENLFHIQRLGIICDIEKEGVVARTKEIKDGLRDAGFIQPMTAQKIASGKPSVAYLLLPVHQETGCIEHVLLQSVSEKYAHLLECSDNHLSCIMQKENWNENKQAKVKIGAMMLGYKPEILWQDSGGTSLWDWEKPALREILQFLQAMNAFAE